MINPQRLQSFESLIAAPFITVEFGGAQFGLKDNYNKKTGVRDTVYVTSLEAEKKASGTVSTYKLNMSYTVEPGSDPNYIDYIISKAKDRNILFTYGDASQPQYTYAREKAIITNINPSLQIASNSIQYMISATSSVALSYFVSRTFPVYQRAKPSNIIMTDLLYGNRDTGLLDLFTGMRDKQKVVANGWIAANDVLVYIASNQDIEPLTYLKLLVSKMRASDGSFFAMIIHDEPDNLDGPYFEIVNSNLHQGQGNIYSLEVDVGYPSSTPVFSFVAQQNTSLALITEYQGKLDTGRIIDVNLSGEQIATGTPSLAIKNGREHTELRQWWNNMTSYPINATLLVRGLIKPAILCNYLDINVLFFGQPYTYSGRYMVTGQRDTINASGYKTELSLVRVSSMYGEVS